MTPWPAATPGVAGTELLERAVSYTRASLSVVTAVDLGRSTRGLRSRDWDWAWSRACGVGRARCSGPGASFTRRSRSS